jgi:hypothetical protein
LNDDLLRRFERIQSLPIVFFNEREVMNKGKLPGLLTCTARIHEQNNQNERGRSIFEATFA